MSAGSFQLACLDMAGTTVADDGVVIAAFFGALDACGVGPEDERRDSMLQYVKDTMGTSKIQVFRSLFGEESLAEKANAAFEASYDSSLGEGLVRPLPGAEEAIRRLRAGGVKVALHTGFSARTRDRLIAALGWDGLADFLCCPAEAGRGRPYPDMILTSLLRLEVDDVRRVAVAGDTAADVESGLRAGAGLVAGVLTGADDTERLSTAGAHRVIASVTELPALLGC